MKSLTIFTTAAIIISTVIGSSNLSKFKVRLIDHDSRGAGTWLFRTNLPIINGTFAYDTLLNYMQERALEANISFPAIDQREKLKLIDISFLNLKEYFDMLVEQDFFAAHPDLGTFYNWPIVGSLLSPNWLSEAERIKEVAALNTSFDALPTKIP